MEISDVPSGKLTPYRRLARILYIILASVAVLASAGLDYLNWKKGESSFLFGIFGKAKAPESTGVALGSFLPAYLRGHGIPPGSFQGHKDDAGVYHLKVELTAKDYARLETSLEQGLKKGQVVVKRKEEQQDKDRAYFLWQVERAGEKGIILFSCLVEKPPIIEEPQLPRAAKSKVALIVDDMGNSLDMLEALCALKKRLTISILPFSSHAKETAEVAYQHGLEVMLHLPLESLNNQEADSQTEGIIYSWAPEEEVKRILDDDLDKVPYIKGVNNHMGSKITADEPIMRTILFRLKEKGLFFIDSRTSGKSIAYDLAQQMGIPSAYRQVFLDAPRDGSSIKARMIELFGLAQKRGRALGICHPTEATLQALQKNLALADRYNLELVFASQIVHK